jgi:chorismate synthase
MRELEMDANSYAASLNTRNLVVEFNQNLIETGAASVIEKKEFISIIFHQKLLKMGQSLQISILVINLFSLFSNIQCWAPNTVSTRGSHHNLYMGTGNSFGKVFKISTFGESHGTGVGVTVDGCPPRIPLTVEDVQRELDRRKPGQSRLTTPRDESDTVEIMSGIYDGITLGTPIGMVVRNKDQRSKDYADMAAKYRPSHADATYDAKYGVQAVAGGGRSSARETIGRVAAGAIAKKILKLYSNVEIVGYVVKVQDIELFGVNHDTVCEEDVEANIARCPDEETANRMIARIDEIRLVDWMRLSC